MPSEAGKDKEQRASELKGVCLQFRPRVSAERQKELRDSQPREPPWGEGGPRSLPIANEGSPPGRCPAPRPLPARRSRPRPAHGGARGEVGSGAGGWKRGWVAEVQAPAVAPELPTRGRGLASPAAAAAAAAPRLPRPQPPRPPLGSDTCFAEQPPPPALPGRALQPPPPPGLEHAPGCRASSRPRQLPAPAAPAACLALLPTPTGQPPPLPPPSGH
ncbi:skin secretory protein xP2-like [Equus quagga]|uniref:skin secretory protein xP2-like n=1 Tax=Equus quagga TaxID=89248 RepID=UPI001EE15515|nr:skin secretory protein xP2-like [Equus quagga]